METEESIRAYRSDPRRAPDRELHPSLWRCFFPPKAERAGDALLIASQKRGPDGSPAEALKGVARALKAGADVDFPTMGEELRALHLAAKAGNDLVCEALILAGANIEAWDMNSSTPLQLAAAVGSLACVKALLAAGADPNAASGAMKESALHIAAGDDRAEIALALMEAGARQTPNYWGRYPLHMAIHGGETARLLVEIGGADPQARDNEGQLPLDVAKGRGAGSAAVEGHRRLLSQAIARREAAAIEGHMATADRSETPALRRPRI